MKSESLTQSAVWLMLAKTLGFALSVALPLSLVRVLDQRDFGLYKQAFLIINTAVWVLPFGFGMSAFYFLPRESERRGAVVCHVVVFNLLVGSLAALALFLWPWVLGTLFKAPEIVEYAPLIGLVILLAITASFIEIVVVANQETRVASVFIVQLQFMKAAVLLLATALFGTIKALVVAAIAHGLVQTLILLWYLHSRFGDFWRRASTTMLREQFMYAVPLGLSGLLLIAQTDVHNYFVAYRFDPSIYALYAVGCFQFPLTNLLAESVGAVLIPRVSLLQQAGRFRDISHQAFRVMRKLALVHFPLYGFMLVLGKELVSTLFTEQYAASWPILAINMAILPFSIVALDPIIRAFGPLSRFLLRLRVVMVAAQVLLLWFVTARFGLVLTISVVAGAKIVESMILTYRTARTLGVTRADLSQLAPVAKIALATAGAAVTGASIRLILGTAAAGTVVLIGGTGYAIAYAVGVLGVGVLTLEEQQAIVRRWKMLQRHTTLRRATDPQPS